MKKVAIVFGILLLLVVVLIVGVSLYLNDDRLRALVLPQIQEATGREVQIERISYSLFGSLPQFGLTIEGLVVPDPREEKLASIDRLHLTLNLMPLLGGELSIHTLQIDRPEFTFIIYEDGTTNLDDFLAESEVEEEPEEDDQPAPSAVLDLAEFVITNATFGFVDHQSETLIRIGDLNLSTSLRYAEQLESTLDLTIGGVDLTLEGQMLLEGLALSLSQASRLDLEQETAVIESGQFSIMGLAMTLEGMVSNWSSGEPVLDLRMNYSSEDFGVLLGLVPSGMRDLVAGLDTGGAFGLSASLQGQLTEEQLPAFEVSLSISDGFVQHRDVPERITDINLSLSATNELFILETFRATAGENRLAVNAELVNPLEDSASFSLNGTVNADLGTAHRYVPLSELGVDRLVGLLEINARAGGQLSAPEESDFDLSLVLSGGSIALSDMPHPIDSIVASVQATPSAINLNDLSIRAATNTFSASGQLTNYMGGEAAFDASLDARIVLNELNNFYPLEDELGLVLSGLVTSAFQLRGGLEDLDGVRLDGAVTMADVNLESPDMPQPLRGLNGSLQFRGDEIVADGFSFNLGESDFLLNGSISQFRSLIDGSADAPPVRFDGQLRSRSINANQFMALDTGPAEVEERPREPFEAVLPNLAGTFEINVGSLQILDMNPTDIVCRLQVSPSHLGSDRIELAIFGGTIAGNFRWDIFAVDHTGLTFNGALNNLRVEEFFAQFNPGRRSKLAEHVRGSFSGSTEFYAELDEYFEIVTNKLRSSGGFGMASAHVAGHPVQNGLVGVFGDELADLTLNSWSANYRIEDGTMHVEDCNLRSQDFEMRLSGSHNLITDEMNYRTDLLLPRRVADRLGGVLPSEGMAALTSSDGRVTIPVTIRGSSDSPQVGVDDSSLRGQVEDYLRSQVDDRLRDEVSARRREAERAAREAEERIRQEAAARRREAEQRVREAEEQVRQEARDRARQAAEEHVPDDAVNRARDRLGL